MKNLIYFTISFLILLSAFTTAQTVSGKMVDEQSIPIGDMQLQLYAEGNVYETFSTPGLTLETSGNFTFNLTTSVKDNQLPDGYSISNNYPNPFNPKTRIDITMQSPGEVKVSVFNLLGQKVIKDIQENFSAGIHFVDLELNGLSNGVYFARITIGEKYFVTKKMMLIYGSKHLQESSISYNNSIPRYHNTKNLLNTELDSLVATNEFVGSKTFTNLPAFSGDSVNLGELVVERHCPGIPTINYDGKIYHTVQIGAQCWLKENLDVGVMINGAEGMNDNGVIEKYCYDNNPANCATYGGLYQWNELMLYTVTEGTQGICPTGWHIPTITEFEELGDVVLWGGNKLKSIGQGTGGGSGTNTSGYSALISGFRYIDGSFRNFGTIAYFWSSTQYSSTNAHDTALSSENSTMPMGNINKNNGFSVRCLKN